MSDAVGDMCILGTSVEIVLPQAALDTLTAGDTTTHRDRWETFLGELAQGFTRFSAQGMWRGASEDLYFYKVSLHEQRLVPLIQYLRQLREDLVQDAIFFSVWSNGHLILPLKPQAGVANAPSF